MKKWLAGLGVLALIGTGAVRYYSNAVSDAAPKVEIRQGRAAPNFEDAKEIRLTREDVHQGKLLLVNKEHAVPRNNAASAEAVRLADDGSLTAGFGLLDDTIRLSPEIAEKFAAMVADAREDGVEHFLISSGYRDNKEQARLYREMGPEFAMRAGHSEHNLGLALDVGSTLDEMKRAPEGEWLADNAWKHGFVLRYPKHKTHITGIEFEPWHYRYVGLPHSAIMKQNDWVLEEYLDALGEQGTMSTSIDGRKYDIYYFPVANNTTVRVPVGKGYELSGNNADGVAVTVFY